MSGMVGRVYGWRKQLWRVVTRWEGPGPRNVLIERVYLTDGKVVPVDPPERVVRPFRGLRRIDREV
jgi:hypothetical protein